MQLQEGRSNGAAKETVNVDAASLVILASDRVGQQPGCAGGCGKAGIDKAGPQQASADAEPSQAPPPPRCGMAQYEPSRRYKEQTSTGSASDRQQAGDVGSKGVGGSKLRGGTNNNGGRWKRARGRAWDVLVSPNIIAVTVGVVVAMIAPLKKMLFENPQAVLRPLGAAVQVRAFKTC